MVFPGVKERVRENCTQGASQMAYCSWRYCPCNCCSSTASSTRVINCAFASHGQQDIKHPLDSALIISDGLLKVSDIMCQPEHEADATEKIIKSMSLAFLSACETAKGDETIPDEAMHLAATLMFAGFRRVVATMW